jgi:hypothetical protein
VVGTPWDQVEQAGILPSQVCLRGGPFPLLRLLGGAGPGRVLPDIQHSGPEMCFIHGRGAVTCQPSRTYTPQAHVDGAGIFGVNPPKGAGEGVRALRHGRQ